MDWADTALKLSAAAALGGLIGLDREIKQKSAGVRTIGVVALGSAIAVIAAGGAFGDINAVSRVLQGALAGIGFLGAGVIMHHERSIDGLTTAAAIWAAAALGAACGMGQWPLVISGGALLLLMLVAAGWIEHALRKGSQKGP